MGKISITDENMTVKVSTPSSVVGLNDLIDNLVIPALLGLGFGEKLISQYINSEILDGNKE